MTKETEARKCFAVIKVRGTISALREARETLAMLRLNKTNHTVLIDNRPSYVGMLYKAQNYITWGEVDKGTVEFLLQKRGRFLGGEKLTDESLEKLGFKSITDLAQALVDCKVDYQKLPDIQPVFKLRPPSKGFKGKTKKSFVAGGETGYRGEKINELLKRMA